jgi:hypothetical protein
VLSWQVTNTKLIVFGLTCSGHDYFRCVNVLTLDYSLLPSSNAMHCSQTSKSVIEAFLLKHLSMCKILFVWMSDWLLFDAKWANCQLYHGVNRIHSMTWWPLCTRPTHLVLVHWHNSSPRVDMLLHENTLSWFRANQYLLLQLKAVCQAENIKCYFFFYWLWFDPTGARPCLFAAYRHTQTIFM